MTISLLRRTSAATTVLLLGLSLAACGGDGDDSSNDEPSPAAGTSDVPEVPDETATSEPVEPTTTVAPPPAVVPSEDELASVLLTTADLPAGFVEGEPEDDDDSDTTFDGTCIADVGEFDDVLGTEPDAEAETEFTLETEAGQSFVGSKVTAYADPAPVAEGFTSFVDTLQECTSVSTTDDDGIAFDLDIAYDEAATVPDADQQVAISMTGTISGQGQSFDLAYNFVVALTGGFISIVGASEVGESGTGVLESADDFAVLQGERLGGLLG